MYIVLPKGELPVVIIGFRVSLVAFLILVGLFQFPQGLLVWPKDGVVAMASDWMDNLAERAVDKYMGTDAEKRSIVKNVALGIRKDVIKDGSDSMIEQVTKLSGKISGLDSTKDAKLITDLNEVFEVVKTTWSDYLKDVKTM